jgi:hypothetical protein
MRATLDRLISWGGLLLALVLLVAGGLLTWANVFISNEVHDQLAAQHITMPTEKTGLADLPQADQDALAPYAGQQMTTGPQAKAYADHYIAVHLNGVADGKTYSEVSGEYMAKYANDPKAAQSPEGQAMAAQRTTLFQGETLRGLLLYGAAFATMGTIAGFAGIGAFVASALLFLLVGFGFWHSRRASHLVAVESQPVGAHV